MATIKRIEGRTVHQIQSGQVIVDLCSVVKELVENGLDARATSIEVRFKNQGLEAIEVQDNGHGISSSNYETLALKHYTSKLSTYADLNTLQTFGFRGEALSSLCALSKFSVVTCLAQDAPKGTRLEFEQSGALKAQGVVAAQKGTTVTVENIFYNLPVRKRELERNIKREWTRVINTLQQYACIQTNVKISVLQQAGKGKKTVMFSTKGNPTTRENLVNLFGAKTLVGLIALDLQLELEPTTVSAHRRNVQKGSTTKDVQITGHISRPAWGEGRQTPDRQMFFVNGRPCALPQIAKAFNEAYKAYNSSQSPFILANIELNTDMYDVNVSPDKRTILLHEQTKLLENLKVALTELFDSQDYTVPISQLPTQKQPSFKQLTLPNAIQPNNSTESPLDEDPLLDDEESSENTPGVEEQTDSEDENAQQLSHNKGGHEAVSRQALGDGASSISLISNWPARNAEDRITSGTKLSTPNVKPQPDMWKRARESGGEQMESSDEVSAHPESTITNTQNSVDAPSLVTPQRVHDFNDRLSELQQSRPRDSAAPVATSHAKRDVSSIPSLPTPAKPSPSIAERFSTTTRTLRTPADFATITIEGETTISPVGSPAKRPRTQEPVLRSVTHPEAKQRELPSFGARLSQRFAAPGALVNHERGDVSEAEGDEEEEQTDKIVALDEDPDANENSSSPETLIESDRLTRSVMPEPNTQQDEVVHEEEQRALEAARVKEAITSAEEQAQGYSQENFKRANSILKGAKRKDSTLDLMRIIKTTVDDVSKRYDMLQATLQQAQAQGSQTNNDEGIDSANAEEKLALTISKSDFATMRVIGQFNLGFILATRSSQDSALDSSSPDDVFIIDQHASDEKYNFERLYATTIVQSQRLVHPKPLELTAMEEELVLEHQTALTKNGFVLSFDDSGESPVGSRCHLLSLPLSRETTFSLSDLEELISLLADAAPGSVPRPSKVRKMLAMRACRSSVMIGKTLTHGGMERLVRHLGELDKPWNCPHGRPTMRHLCGLGVWDEEGWKGDVGDAAEGYDDASLRMERIDWGEWLRREEDGEEEPEGMEEDDEEEEEGGENFEGEDQSLFIPEEDN